MTYILYHFKFLLQIESPSQNMASNEVIAILKEQLQQTTKDKVWNE